MRRLLAVLAVLGLTAGAVLAVTELTRRTSRSYRVAGSASQAGLRLSADRYVTPLDAGGLLPGSRFSYSFRVTNDGEALMRHVVVRSVKVADGMTIVGLSDPACWGVGHCECIFQRLNPGETRTVRVTVESSPQSRPGDRLLIRTFAGRFSGSVDGSIPLDVAGEAQVTTGRFG